MHLHVGGVAVGQAQHVHACTGDGVHTDGLQKLQVLGQTGDLIVAGQGVAGHVDPRPLVVGQLHGLGHLIPVEVAGKGPHAEGVARQIHGVSPVGQGHGQSFHVPGGG